MRTLPERVALGGTPPFVPAEFTVSRAQFEFSGLRREFFCALLTWQWE